jgi:hypothetical protein
MSSIVAIVMVEGNEMKVRVLPLHFLDNGMEAKAKEKTS